jgi:hypothetical protein
MGVNKIELPKGNSRIVTATLTDSNGDALDLTSLSAVYLSVQKDKANDDYTELHLCDVAWDEAVTENVTVTVDTADFQEGEGSVKMAVADGVAAGLLATDAITSVDLSSGYTSIHLWIKSSVNTDAGDLQLLLDNTASCASPKKTLDIPALTAATWTHVVLDLGDCAQLSAIISVGLYMAVDKGAFNVWVDNIVGANYVIEKLAGSVEGDPTLGIVAFEITPALTLYQPVGTWDYDVHLVFTDGSEYTPITDEFEIIAHAYRAV